MNVNLNRHLYNKFYHDYISEKSEAHNFIDSPYHISWNKLSSSIDLNSDHYQHTRQILISQNSDLDSEKASLYRDYLLNKESVILITGQQLGLFASPLYTIYKIISTIKLAEELNKQQSQLNYVPVFWLETEDHDFNEINHIGLLDKGFVPKQHVYQGKDLGKVSLRHYQLESSIGDFISDIKEDLLDTEFSENLFSRMLEIYKPFRDWSSAIREFLKEVFYDYGLLFFHPGDSEIKTHSVEFFTNLLIEGQDLRNAFFERSDKLISKGYHNQVKNIPGQTFIHIEQENNQRSHLYSEGSQYYFKDSKNRYNQEEILQLMRENPSRISSTVVSRPLLQSWLLPVAGYIAGPGEIAYWAQLGQMFEELNLVMPALYPRISASIIEPKIGRYLKKYKPDLEAMPFKKGRFIKDYFKNLAEEEGSNPISQLNETLDQEADTINSYLQTLDPTLVGIGKKSIERMKQSLSNLEHRVIKSREQKQSQLANHLEQIHFALFPNEVPQERFQSIVYYINKFGPQVVDRFFTDCDIKTFNHQLLYL